MLMRMVYRDDVEALEARHAVLEAEVAERERARDEVARMLAEARAREEAHRRLADLAAGGPARGRRRRILIAAAATVLMLLGAGLSYRLTRPSPDLAAEVIQRLSLYADQACSCADSACTQRVLDDLTQWGQEMSKEVLQPPKLTSAQQDRANDIARRLGECMTKTMTAEQATGDR